MDTEDLLLERAAELFDRTQQPRHNEPDNIWSAGFTTAPAGPRAASR